MFAAEDTRMERGRIGKAAESEGADQDGRDGLLDALSSRERCAGSCRSPSDDRREDAVGAGQPPSSTGQPRWTPPAAPLAAPAQK